VKNLFEIVISFLILVFVSFFMVTTQAKQIEDCQPKNIELWVQASFASDGDTIIIQNKKFKLIGINAPQKERKQKFNTSGQPLAKESQNRLNKLLANHDMQVGIEYDTSKIDSFNRGLLHLYVKKDDQIYNLNQLMLATGYALFKSEYNNNLHQQCYYQAEKIARSEGIALWSLYKNQPKLNYPVVLSNKITLEDDGFRIFKGKIVSVQKSSTNYILNMDTVGIRITKKYWNNFDFKQLQDLKGKIIEVRGNGFLFKRSMFVKIQSPNAIDRLRKLNVSTTK
jgi:endonuclease YncB( thermonuclease family)